METDPSLDLSLGYWVHRLDSAMRVKFEQRLEPLGVTPSEWSILTLCFQKCLSPGHLARTLGQKPPLITRWLRNLEAKGFIERSSDKLDGRCWNVSLTERGEQIVPSLRAQSQAMNAETLASLESSEQKQLLNLIKKAALSLLADPEEK